MRCAPDFPTRQDARPTRTNPHPSTSLHRGSGGRVREAVHNFSQAQNPRAIFIGSLSGLEQGASIEVANTASKFALRGAIQSLRLALRDRHIGLGVINPGNVATAEVLTDIQEGRFPPQEAIPLGDLVSCIDWILSLSPQIEGTPKNKTSKTFVVTPSGVIFKETPEGVTTNV